MEYKNKKGHHKIAIVGTGSLFPGAINTKDFWLNILAEKDFIKDVPDSHWLKEDYYDPKDKTGDKVYCKKGSFLDDISFDPVEFGMPPNLLSTTDTVQLLSLIVARDTLEDTLSYKTGKVDPKKISVILGIAGGTELLVEMGAWVHKPEWVNAMRKQGLSESKINAIKQEINNNFTPWTENTFPGLLGNVVSGRIANRFNLNGTNCVLDAACASSLAAVKMGIQELQLGTTDMVITGGTDAFNDISMFMCFCKTTALSPTEDCKPFSDDGDGTVIGEAIAMFTLKRLEDAERDGDKIYAVIASIGSSSDGRSGSIYAPDSNGQSIAINRAYVDAGFSPDEIDLVEAHGTGTMAGDYSEFNGLKLGYGKTKQNQYCALGSVKSMIGHTKSAAGAASVLKIAMALNNSILPPTIKITHPNPKLNIKDSPFYLNTKTRPWIHEVTSSRKAGVSSMGFGGTNFHIAMEEYSNINQRPKKVYQPKRELILFSGKDKTEILKSLSVIQNEVIENNIVQLAKKSQLKFDSKEYCRLAILAENITELVKWVDYTRLELAKDVDKIEVNNCIYYSKGKIEGDLAYLFSGQGSQYLNMGIDLLNQYDEALQPWNIAVSLTLDTNKRLNNVVFPIPTFTDADLVEQEQLLVDTKWAQPAIGALAMSHLNLLSMLSIKPSVVGGHSYGEVAALYATGVITNEEDLINISRKRGELMATASKEKGAMTAVFSSTKIVNDLLSKIKSKVVVANINSPTQTVITGTFTEIEKVEKEFEKEGFRFQRLNVSTAFHSELVAGSVIEFEKYLKKVSFGKASIPVYSNTTAKHYPSKNTDYAKILAQQLAAPVQFEDQVNAMYKEGIRIFLEVGPSKVLSNFVKEILKDKPHTTISLDGGKKVNSKDAFWNALGQLSIAGMDIAYNQMWKNVDDNQKVISEKKPSIATVKINGSNFGKPYPPIGGIKNVAKINPEVVEEFLNKTIEIHHSKNENIIEANQVKKIQNPSFQTDNKNNSFESQTQENSKMSGLNSQWLQAFQEIQKNTLEAQKNFQEAMAESHKLFLEVSKSAFEQLGNLSGNNNSSQTNSSYNQHLYTNPSLIQVPNPPAHSSENRVSIASQEKKSVAEALPLIQIPEKKEVPAYVTTVQHTIDFEDTLLRIVSDKTGYPKEILDLSTDLESGLGIDSIKRVEILSALQEEFPQLKNVETAKLAAMNTLREILDFSKSTSPTSVNTSPKDILNTVENNDENLDGFAETMLEIVAEKTGYPKEILDLNTDLESGLGIDSIKRVEILSALQEKFPSLKKVETAKLAAMNTLGEILNFSNEEKSKVNQVNAVVNQPISPISEDSDDLSNFEETMLEIVAEKTGYPKEILDLNTDLESGLGIDSIKRVEILSALQEKFPSLKKVETAKLAAMNTLGEILNFSNEEKSKTNQVNPILNVPSSAPSEDLDDFTNFEETMLAIVAEKTGYPKEILDLNIDLESGLGIDSIKRVEILSALQEKFPSLKKVETAKLAAMNSLGEILAFSVESQSYYGGGVSENPEKKPLSSGNIFRYIVSRERIIDQGFCFLEWQKADTLFLIEDDSGVAIFLEQKFKNVGVNTKIVTNLPNEARFVINLRGINKFNDHSIEQLLSSNFESFQIARNYGKNNTNQNGCLILPFDNGLENNLALNRAWSGGISALAKTANLEWPNVTVQSINISCTKKSPARIADELFFAITSGGSVLEMEIDADGKFYQLTSNVSVIENRSKGLNNGDTIVVSGGAKGITAACLIALSERTKLNIGILGRTELEEEPNYVKNCKTDAELKNSVFQQAVKENRKITPIEVNNIVAKIVGNREVIENIKIIENNGSKVHYFSVDISNKNEVFQAVNELRVEFGAIHGIVHAAGVLADKYIVEKTDEQFNRVFKTKINGFINLLEATSKDKLTHICCFSSVAARMGNVGQVDYAMSNEILNKVCQAEQLKRKNMCTVKSINWGPWEGGMVSESLKKHFKEMGVDLIPLDTGAEIFANEMEDSSIENVEIVVGGTFEKWGKTNNSEKKYRHEMWIHQSNSPFLDSHKIQGKVIVPIMMVNEWSMRLGKSLFPEFKIVEINKVKVYKGIQLDHFDKEGDTLYFEYSVSKNQETAVVEIKIKNREDVLFYGTTVNLAKNNSFALSEKTLLYDLKSWKLEKKNIYTSSLFHGIDFQVVEKLEGISEDGCTGVLKMQNSKNTNGTAWLSDMFMLDGGIQLAVLAMENWTGNNSSLPLGYDSLKIYDHPNHAKQMHCELVLNNKGKMDSNWDIKFKDNDHKTIAQLSGLRLYMYKSN